MDISTATLRGLLDKAWLAAPASANSLRDQLLTFEQQSLALIGGGSLASVSKNSASQSYASGPNALTPLQIQRAWRYLVDLFDEVKAWADDELAETSPDGDEPANDQDPAIYGEMMKRLRYVYSASTDLTQLRVPPTLAPGGALSW